MEASELREMTVAELNSVLHDLKEELFALRFQKSRGNLQSPHRFRHVRKDIARVKTIFREKELEGEDQETG